MSRLLVVNADDFGLCPAVNDGVIRAHSRGIVTSASLMVRSPHAADAVAMARDHPRLSLGLHVDVAEWARGHDGWRPLYQVVPPHDAAALQCEVDRQLDAFRGLVGANPTHVDSHQHLHCEGPLAAITLAVGRRLGIPVRRIWGGVRYRGDFYGQSGDGWPYAEAIGVEALVTLLSSIGDGATEIACHPAVDGDIESVYARERALELATLTDAAVRAAVDANGITLVSFAELTAIPRP